MAARSHNAVSDEAKSLRMKAGKVVAQLRKNAGLSQKKTSDMLGFEYYTTISQWERGFSPIPSEYFEPLAQVLGQDPDEFILLMMEHYEPHLHRAVLRMIEKARKNGRSR